MTNRSLQTEAKPDTRLGTNKPEPQKEEPASIESGDRTEEANTAPPFTIFTKSQKRWIVFLVAFAGMFSPMSSFIYYPAISSIAEDLKISVEQVNLIITTYMVVSGVAPTLLGNAADIFGRRPVYIAAFSTYLVANIGLALQRSFPALLLLRMLQSAGSSGTISLGYGVISDIATPKERGFYVGLVLLGPNVAPPLGPVLGGVVADRLGWNWIFWLLCLLSGFCLAVIICVLPETARCIVGNGSIPARGIHRTVLSMFSRRQTDSEIATETLHKQPKSFVNPLKSLGLLFKGDMAIVLFSNGINYATYCCIQASLSTLFIEIYSFKELEAGLIYIPFGIGCLAASYFSGKLLNLDYRVIAKRQNVSPSSVQGDNIDDFPIERARLRSIFYFVILSVVTLAGYGWTLRAKTHISAPLILQFIIGGSITAIFTSLGTLLTDLNPRISSTAAAAANIVRCALAATGTAVLDRIIRAMGAGWCFTLFAGLCAICAPLLYLERRNGMKWRRARKAKEEVAAQ